MYLDAGAHATQSFAPLLLRTTALVAIASITPLVARVECQAPAGGALIRGRVVDSLGQPIANADAALEGTLHRSNSNGTGVFVLRNLAEGRYRLVVRHVGFEPASLIANIAGPDTMEADIVLRRAENILDSIVVTASRGDLAEFEVNRRLGFGTFFLRDEIEKAAGSALHTLLRTKLSGFTYLERPCGGVSLATGRTRAGASLGGVALVGKGSCPMPDLCYAQLFVDGQRIFGTDHATAPPNIDEYRLEQIEAIEVYTASSSTPARYNTMGAVCGTVALWRQR
ncbi:MAG TPA: carboxypeptidase regulatory-like domain-containing protein [Gemmatimonadaceae bacterium]|nr:carboxypeptidase regulatory-like domain-containing protein [Gemmatimonadaceae bacterium]